MQCYTERIAAILGVLGKICQRAYLRAMSIENYSSCDILLTSG